MTYGYGVEAIKYGESIPIKNKELDKKFRELQWYLGLMEKVIDHTRRRVLNGESVAAEEKVVSIFEPHTDIIVKKHRKTEFGHKVALVGGTSCMILDCVIERGNPSDESLAEKLNSRMRTN